MCLISFHDIHTFDLVKSSAPLYNPLILNFFFEQVVQEYERAVIFRLGRLVKGGAKVIFMEGSKEYQG